MSDDERTLTDETTTSRQAAQLQQPRLAEAAVESVLDLNEVMTQARLVEKRAHICMRGDLQARRDAIIEELAGLVDKDGRILEEDDEKALSDESRALELTEELREVDAEMGKAMRYVLFRALPEDEWREWDKAQPRDADGKYKNAEQAHNALVAKTAIEPTLTVAQVEGLRGKLALPQIAQLVDKAFEACTTGGVDVPKLPHFLLAPRRDNSGMN